MSEFHPNRVRPHRPRLTARRLLNFWPLLVWVAVIGMAYWAYAKGVKFTRMNGLVDPIQEAVSADEDSRIEEILVTTGTKVKKGDPVVKLDTAIIEAQIAKLVAAIRADLEDRVLSHELDLSRVKGERREILRDQASDEGELSAVQAQLTKLQGIINGQPTPQAKQQMQIALAEALGDAQKDVSRLTATTGLYKGQLDELKVDIDRLESEVKKIRDSMDNPEALAAANGDLSELQELRELLRRGTLLSGHDGIVDRVERDNGEFVLKGQTILRIVAYPETIRVLLPNDQLGSIKVNDTVWVSSIIDRYKYFKTEIINMSPRVTNAPNTASPLPNQVVHGQEIIARFPKESGFIPGQPVILHTEEPGSVPMITRLFGGRGRAEQ